MAVNSVAIAILLISFFVMIFLRFPIAYAVALSAVLSMVYQGQQLADICRLMVKGISSFSLMAVPFFITMGALMGSGGISEKLIALANDIDYVFCCHGEVCPITIDHAKKTRALAQLLIDGKAPKGEPVHLETEDGEYDVNVYNYDGAAIFHK